MLTYEGLRDSLGGAVVEGATDYGSWSPNNFRTIIATDTHIYVEYYVGKPTFRPLPQPKNPSRTSPLKIFRNRKFGNLEFLALPASVFSPSTSSLGDVSPHFLTTCRLGAIVALPSPAPDLTPLAKYRHDLLSSPSSALPLPPLLDTPDLLSFLSPQLLLTPPSPPFPDTIHLSPIHYTADQVGSPLYQALQALLPPSASMPDLEDSEAAPYPSPSEPSTAPSPSFSAPSQELVEALKVAKLSSPDLDGFLKAVARLSPEGIEHPAWRFLQQAFPADFSLDASWPITLRNLWFHLPPATRFALGFTPSSPPSSLSSLLSAVSRWGADLDLDLVGEDDEGMGVGIDLSGAEFVPATLVGEEALPALSTPSPTPSVELELDAPSTPDYLAYYSPAIQGIVLDLLEKYDLLFESGYGPVPPKGIIIPDDQGIGRLYAISSNGSAYPLPPDPIIKAVWDLTQESLHLQTLPSRSISAIADAVVNTEDTSTPLYFPYKMLEYAFGRTAKTLKEEEEGHLSYNSSSSAASWAAYREQEVKPSLTRVFESLVKALFEHTPEAKEAYMTSEVEESLTVSLLQLKDALSRCVLVSSHDTLNGLPVKLKVRVLSPTGVFTRNIAKEATLRAAHTDGGRDSQSFDIIHPTPSFWEFRHEANSTLANAEPLFAYKLLEKIQERGDALSPENIILGIMQDDSIATTSPTSPIALYHHTSHGIIGGSRSGKGLLTQAVLSAFLAILKPSGLIDNKPDMASLLLHINPDAFVINGPNITSNPSQGTDLFSQFTQERVRQMEQMAQVPSFIKTLPTYAPGYSGTLGTMAYLRGILLACGILAARTVVGEKLGGPLGVTFIFDEATIANGAITRFIASTAATSLVPSLFLDEWRENQQAEKPKKITPVSEADMWFTAVYQSLKESIDELDNLRNANFSNSEARLSDVFIIGQAEMYPSVGPSTNILPPRNKAAKGVRIDARGIDIVSTLGAVGSFDAFLGYNKDRSHLLNQNPSNKGYSSDKLNPKARNFAYLPNFTGDTLQRAYSGDEGIARQAVYFKPALLFADGREDKYCWKFSAQYMKDAGLNPADVKARNCDPNDPSKLHPGVDFLGYLSMAGISPQMASDSLQVMSDVANEVVSRLGYPGTWQEFILDLRPDWIFSVKDIYRVFADPSYESTLLSEFREVFPDAFSTAAPTPSGLSVSEFYEGDDAQEGVAMAVAFPSPEPSPAFSAPEPAPLHAPTTPLNELGSFLEFSQDDVEETAVFDRLPQTLPTTPSMPDIPTPGYTSQPRVFPQPAPISAEQAQQIIREDVLRFIGDPRKLKILEVSGQSLRLNGVFYQTSLPASWVGACPPYFQMALTSGNIAGIFPWGTLPMFTNLATMKFDSYEFVSQVVIPDLTWGRSNPVDRFFSDFPNLRSLTIGSDEYLYDNFKEVYGNSTGFYRADQVRKASHILGGYLSRATGSSWNYARNSWSRDDLGLWGKTWRTGIGTATAATLVAANATNATTRGIIGAVGSAFRAFRDTFKEFD